MLNTTKIDILPIVQNELTSSRVNTIAYIQWFKEQSGEVDFQNTNSANTKKFFQQEEAAFLEKISCLISMIHFLERVALKIEQERKNFFKELDNKHEMEIKQFYAELQKISSQENITLNADNNKNQEMEALSKMRNDLIEKRIECETKYMEAQNKFKNIKTDWNNEQTKQIKERISDYKNKSEDFKKRKLENPESEFSKNVDNHNQKFKAYKELYKNYHADINEIRDAQQKLSEAMKRIDYLREKLEAKSASATTPEEIASLQTQLDAQQELLEKDKAALASMQANVDAKLEKLGNMKKEFDQTSDEFKEEKFIAKDLNDNEIKPEILETIMLEIKPNLDAIFQPQVVDYITDIIQQTTSDLKAELVKSEEKHDKKIEELTADISRLQSGESANKEDPEKIKEIIKEKESEIELTKKAAENEKEKLQNKENENSEPQIIKVIALQRNVLSQLIGLNKIKQVTSNESKPITASETVALHQNDALKNMISPVSTEKTLSTENTIASMFGAKKQENECMKELILANEKIRILEEKLSHIDAKTNKTEIKSDSLPSPNKPG